MAFRCPYCEFRIVAKTAPKPGKYTPKCPKCGAKIALTVPAEGDEWPTAKIAGEIPNIPAQPEPTLAVPPRTVKMPAVASPPAAAKKSAPALKPVPAPDPDATIAPPSPARRPYDEGETELTHAPLTPAQGSDNTEVTGAFSNDPDATYGQVAADEEDRTGVFEAPASPAAVDERTMARVEAPAPKPKKKAKDVSESDIDMPDTLGGYEVVKELGRGGMGAVFLARQVSLDRPVALKVMNAKWANDPVFLARFTREAYAAAQLVHHNVVQIYDIGEQQGINFFSMEFVEGKSLGDVIKKDGKMTQEAAVSHIVQAARGLKYAHDRGMIHRDVKPDNLMLNVHGLVKVADLGLVKTAAMSAADDQLPGTDADVNSPKKTGLQSLPSDITAVNTAMGSPSYMSPEQCRDASTVDPRADIYSLGCTLYALLSGKPPFQGKTVFEVMAKHATEPMPPISGVSPELNAVVQKSLAKDPAERHQTMDEFIADLETRRPGHAGPFQPTDEHVTTLEACEQKFRNAALAKIRRKVIPAYFLGCLAAVAVGAFVGGLMISLAVLALMAETVVAHFVISGVMGKTFVFRKTREWVFGAKFTDWALALFGGVIVLAALFLLGLHWVFLGAAVLAVALAFGFHFVFDRGAAAQRTPAVDECEKMLKRFRVAGMDEEQLRLFVAQNAGRSWEEFYEALFGYESKLAMREKLAEGGESKAPRFAAWREPLLARVEKAQQARQDAKAKKLLSTREANKLQAEGVSKKEAAVQAEAAAEQMVEQVAVMKAAKPSAKPVNVRKMMQAAAKAPKTLPKKPGQGLKKAVHFVTGWQLRFILGAVMIAAGALWAKQNKGDELAAAQKNVETMATAEDTKGNEAVAKKTLGIIETMLDRKANTHLPIVGTDISPVVDSLNPLVAGLILLMSIFFRSPLSVGLAIAGAFIAAVPHLVIGPIQELTSIGGYNLQLHQITMAVGLLLGALGFVISFKGR